MIRSRLKRSVLAAFCAAALAGAATTAAAESRPFDIPAGELKAVLDTYARQSGVRLIYRSDEVAGIRSPGVVGTLPVEDAIARLLQGTDFVVERDESGAIAVVRRQRPAQSQPGALDRQGPGRSAADGAGVSDLDTVQVTGTRIRDTPPTSPVISFDREDLDRGGYASTQEVFAKVPQNFSGISTGTGGQTGYYTTSQIDLRGLGPESTLTLVDGRRVSRAAGHEGRALDIGMIPVSVIERIDILTDGASALYGSDAVAGVVNLILRDDFEGAESSVQYGSGATGVDQLLLSHMFGTRWDGGRLLVAAQYDRRDALRSSELGITTLDLRGQGGGDYRFAGIGSPGTVYSAGFFAGMPFSTVTTPDGGPVFSIALPQGDGRNLRPEDLALNQQTFLDGPGRMIPHELAPEQESSSLYLNLEQELGPVTLFADAVASKRDSRLLIIPPVNYLLVPATNAFSPFGEPVMVGYSLTEFDAASKWENLGWFSNLGVRGRLGVHDWTWEAVGSVSRDVSRGRSQGYDSAGLNARLASADPAFAFNPFGDGSGQSPGVVEALFQNRHSEGRTAAYAASFLAQGGVADLPGGELRLALGSEYRYESLESFRGGEGVATTTQFARNSQDAVAAFGEAYLPFFGAANARPGMRELALSLAARYERYAGFGDTFNPKVGLLWRPSPSLLLKTNWGTSFRAPSLRELHYPTSVNETARVHDPRAPGGPRDVFYRLMLGGNPGLEPETADTFSLAGEYRPQWLEGARISGSYYRIDYEKRITGAGDGLTQALLFEYEDHLPPGVIVRDASGNLVSLSTAYVNSARTRISGWDLQTGYSWHTGLGYFDVSASATFAVTYDNQIVPGAPMQRQAGVIGAPPEWRGRMGLSWSQGGWGAHLSVNRIDGMEVVDPDPRIVRRDVAGQTTADLQLSYAPEASPRSWFRGLSFRLGANSLFNELSPFVDGPMYYGIGQQNFLFEGRSVYLRVSKRFGEER